MKVRRKKIIFQTERLNSIIINLYLKKINKIKFRNEFEKAELKNRYLVIYYIFFKLPLEKFKSPILRSIEKQFKTDVFQGRTNNVYFLRI